MAVIGFAGLVIGIIFFFMAITGHNIWGPPGPGG
jgi:hypothetical protein